jgi:hypothetical protein
MKKSLFWLLAILITLTSAVYQRMTGPTHPLRGKATVDGSLVRYRLPRSADSTGNLKVALPFSAPAEGYLEYKRYKTDDPWVREPLVRQEAELVGFLPKQPAAGKLLYRVHLVSGGKDILLGGEAPVVVRFKDHVPIGLLIIHIIVMFAGMLAATAAGLAALDKNKNPRRFVLWAAALIFVGGFILGPLVQKYAFGVLWSGVPFGMDLTDNKTLITFLIWVVALIAGRKGKPARAVVLIASVVTLVVYLIPHSLFGSELKYTKMN